MESTFFSMLFPEPGSAIKLRAQLKRRLQLTGRPAGLCRHGKAEKSWRLIAVHLVHIASKGAGGNKHGRAPAASPTGEIILHSLVSSVKTTAARRMIAQQLDSCNGLPDRKLCLKSRSLGPFENVVW